MRLEIKSIGEVPSFKNSKVIVRPKGRRAMLMTQPVKRKWMDAASALFESQLRSFIRAKGIPTLTGEQLLCSIATLLPLDDSRKWMAVLNVSWRQVSKGCEGAEVDIELL